jgi:hypothetical protein
VSQLAHDSTAAKGRSEPGSRFAQARAEASMICERADYRAVEPRDAPDRRVRNLILLANVAAWVAIILLFRFIF